MLSVRQSTRGAIPSLLILILLTVFGVAIFIGVRIIQQRTQTKSQAGETTPTIKVLPAETTTRFGETVTFNIFIDTAGSSIVGADVELSYDPNAFTIDEAGVQAGEIFPVYLGSFDGGRRVDASTGQIALSGLASPNDSSPPTFSGDAGLFATINATVRAAGWLDVRMTTAGATDDSNLTEAGTGRDILARVQGAQVEIDMSEPEVDVLDRTYLMKVLVLKYFPLTADGQRIDQTVTGDVGAPYAEIRQKTINITNNLIDAIERSTTYLGYRNPNAKPALRYQIVDTKEYLEAVPISPTQSRANYPNYRQMMTDNNICDYVDNQDVREVWIWAYHGRDPRFAHIPGYGIDLEESKMAGPFGDISNSWRTNDMPTCTSTYRVYTFNYGRGTAEAFESWSHQIEAEMDAIDRPFFREKFQGPNYPQTLGVNGRCGSVHNPPNARFEYDRSNVIPSQSDCFEWNPDGLGGLSSVDCDLWGCGYRTDGDNSALNYMIWNWQNLPGRRNTLTYQGEKIRNLWDIHGDFDTIMRENRTIFAQIAPQPSPIPTPTPTPATSLPTPHVVPTPPPQSPPPSPSPTPIVLIPGDYNSDGVVNTLDLSVQYANWGRNPDPSVDLNDDTRVNSVDYGILLQNFSTE